MNIHQFVGLHTCKSGLDGLRIGQRFVNLTGIDVEGLFYETDSKKALDTIVNYLLEYDHVDSDGQLIIPVKGDKNHDC